MHLATIKLVGFKSFAEPSTLHFPDGRVGIVGPNGCGKSNIIDAVRWVLGESSAKFLRGETGLDVIFNGSSIRKPLSYAQVELIFDNTKGRIGGAYKACAELSVKREMTRDLESRYYLNHVACRRRDVTELFLGTGLGQRSYAIIEQNTVSRFIEAKPEVLRTYFEEAAGLSHYKENRKETTSKIERTRQNLNRINDVRQELTQSLSQLKEQATLAEEYKTLKQEERSLQTALYAKRWHRLSEQNQIFQTEIERLQQALQEQEKASRAFEQTCEEDALYLHEAGAKQNQLQVHYYELSGQAARLEQAVIHHHQKVQGFENRLKEIDREQTEASHTIHTAATEREEAKSHQSQLQLKLADLRIQLENHSKTYHDLEKNLERCDEKYEEENKAYQALLAHTRQSALLLQDKKTEEARKAVRLEYLQKKIEEFSNSLLPKELAVITAKIEEKGAQCAASHTRLLAYTEELETLKKEHEAILSEEDLLSKALKEIQKEEWKLKTEQQVALGGGSGELSDWLNQKGILSFPTVLDLIQIEPGYERAVECVLSHLLGAHCLPEEETLFSLVHDFIQAPTWGNWAFIVPHPQKNGLPLTDPSLLLTKIHSEYDFSSLLNGIIVVDSLEDAFRIQKTLSLHESVITQEGVWLGKHWGRIQKQEAHAKTAFHRAQQLTELAHLLQEKERQLDIFKTKREAVKQKEKAIENECKRLREQETKERLEKSEGTAEKKTKTLLLSRELKEKEDAQKLLGELEEEQSSHQKNIQQITLELEHRLLQKEETERKVLALQEERSSGRQAFKDCKKEYDHYKEGVSELSLNEQVQAVRVEQAELNLKRSQTALDQLRNEKNAVSAELKRQQEEEVLLKEQEETKRREQKNTEQAVAEGHKALQTVEEMQKSKRAHRVVLESELHKLRTEIEHKKLAAEETRVRLSTWKEQATLWGIGEESESLSLADPETEDQLERRLKKVKKHCEQMGPVNLVAIEEHAKQSERKLFLDKQVEDLQNALQTLEAAIAQIDTATKSRFQATFQAVNLEFGQLFPKIFQGGKAWLEMTEPNLLTTGVNVIAHPPGKANRSIHSLSGGEKALTAIALMFAIFRLNPAPFCMCDEVDAPLDDVNTERFSSLIEALAKDVQFILVTHNKITMTKLTHLIGVTMQEPGVSRLVSVDLERALSEVRNENSMLTSKEPVDLRGL
ncbi:MAG: chromosome segregation protein SMC [Gammaproteobacteria bacterium]|nr:chromosome segregation protein SMC [Gammaproteobacteria bacterium]